MKKPQKLIIIIAAVIVVIGASAGAAVLVRQYQASVEKSKTEETSNVPQKLPSERKADEADALAYKGDVSGGVAELDKAIEKTGDSYEKFVYYSRKATLLFNHHDLAGALEAATQAYELQKTSDSAAFVGQIAREKGDNSLALEYYKKAIERIDPSDPFADEDKEYYKGIVAELGGSQ